MATAADSTHPNGMHSCSSLFGVNTVLGFIHTAGKRNFSFILIMYIYHVKTTKKPSGCDVAIAFVFEPVCRSSGSIHIERCGKYLFTLLPRDVHHL